MANPIMMSLAQTTISRQKLLFLLVFLFSGWFGMTHQAHALTCNDQADGNWNNAGTWSCGAIPGSGDDVTIDSNTVTLTGNQSAKTVTISGGTFTMSSYTLSMYGSYTYTSGTFNAGTGTLSFNASLAFTPGGVNYNNIIIATDNATYTISGTATVLGSLTISTGSQVVIINSGTFIVSGNVNQAGTGVIGGTGTIVIGGSGNQTLSATGGGNFNHITINKPSGSLLLSGTIPITGNWTYTSGTVDPGNSTLRIYGTSTFTPGSVDYYNLTYGGSNLTITLSGTANVLNAFDISATSNLVMTGGTINVGGNISSSGAVGMGAATTALVVNGSGPQTLSSAGGGGFKNITINKPSGTLTLSGTIPIIGNWTYTKGTIDPGSSTLSITSAVTITSTSSAYYNNLLITTGGSGYTVTFSGVINVNTLTLSVGATNALSLSGGTINISGNLSCTNSTTTCLSGGTTTLGITGAGAQTISSSGGALAKVVINKPSGVLTLSGTIPFVGNLTWQAGTVDAGSSTIEFIDSATFTPGPYRYNTLKISTSSFVITVTLASSAYTQHLIINTSSANPATLSGNSIYISGDLSAPGSSIGLNGSTVLVMEGSNNQTISSVGGGPFTSITINKTGGTLSLSGTVPLLGSWIWQAGKIDAGTSTLRLISSGVTTTFTPGASNRYYNLDFQETSGGAGTVNIQSALVVTNAITTSATGGSGINVNTNNNVITTKDFTWSGTSKVFSAGSSAIKISGNFSHPSSAFTAGTSTVILNGTNQTISGTTTFYNLYKMLPNTTTDTLTFTAATTYTIASGGTARFIGTRGYPLSIQSSSAGSAFTLTKTGSVIAEYVSLKDSTISGSTSAVASTNVSGNTSWVFTKEFVSTIRATGGDYTTLSGWEAALGTVDLTAAATKVFSHSGITGTIADNSSVTGATSSATGTVIHATSTQILIKSISGTFQSGEQIRVNVSNYVTSSDTGNGAIAVAECYNDWPNALNDSVTISGETTDADNFILIVAPLGQRHMGKLKDDASGYYRGFTLNPSAQVVPITNTKNYTRLIGLAVDGTGGSANDNIDSSSAAANVLIQGCLSANATQDGISADTTVSTIVNNLVYGSGRNGIYINEPSAGSVLYNDTIQGSGTRGLYHYSSAGNRLTVKNTLSTGSVTADFQTGAGALSVTYSASSDATSDDFGTTTGDRVSQTFSFVDTTNKDYHLLKKDTGGKNFGLDLSTDSIFPIIDDIESDVRPAVNPSDTSEVSYDMGMDEYDYDTNTVK